MNRPVERVVLLHGIWRTPRCMRRLQRALEQAGFEVLNVGYPSIGFDLGELADKVWRRIEPACADGVKVHFIGFSMGGLIIRVLLGRYRVGQLGSVVMIGTPNGGSEVADALKDWWLYWLMYSKAGQQLVTDQSAFGHLFGRMNAVVGIVAGSASWYPFVSRWLPAPHDGMVAVERTRLAGMKEQIVVPVSHNRLPVHPDVIQRVVRFVVSGSFAAPPMPAAASPDDRAPAH